MGEFKNPLPSEAHKALSEASSFLHQRMFPGGMRSAAEEGEAKRIFYLIRRALCMEQYGTPEPPPLTVKPAPSFQPPETCPDCLMGVPFGTDGKHVKH